jgi:hypothetical protein
VDEKAGPIGIDMNVGLAEKKGDDEKQQKNVNRFYDVEDNKDELIKLRAEQEFEKNRHLANDRQRSRQAQLEEEIENDRLYEAEKKNEKELIVKLNETQQIQKEREIAQRMQEEAEKELGGDNSKPMFYRSKPAPIPPTMIGGELREEGVSYKTGEENQEDPKESGGYSLRFDQLLISDTDKYF